MIKKRGRPPKIKDIPPLQVVPASSSSVSSSSPPAPIPAAVISHSKSLNPDLLPLAHPDLLPLALPVVQPLKMHPAQLLSMKHKQALQAEQHQQSCIPAVNLLQPAIASVSSVRKSTPKQNRLEQELEELEHEIASWSYEEGKDGIDKTLLNDLKEKRNELLNKIKHLQLNRDRQRKYREKMKRSQSDDKEGLYEEKKRQKRGREKKDDAKCEGKLFVHDGHVLSLEICEESDSSSIRSDDGVSSGNNDSNKSGDEMYKKRKLASVVCTDEYPMLSKLVDLVTGSDHSILSFIQKHSPLLESSEHALFKIWELRRKYQSRCYQLGAEGARLATREHLHQIVTALNQCQEGESSSNT